MSDHTETFRIGQVRDELRDEFQDLSISKLRFLEDQGLVTPTRTAGGYRQYTGEDVERLRQILRLQRDEFLPLRVIRDHLRKRMDGPAAERKSAAPASDRRAARLDIDPEQPMGWLSVAELAEQAGVPFDFARECQEYGLIGQGQLGDADVTVVAAARTLARYGVGVRHLRQIGAAARAQAELVGRFAQARARQGDASAQASRHAADLADDLFALVREIFVRESSRALADLGAGAGRTLAPGIRDGSR